ncbi:penicillin amidase [Bacteriovorax sp. BSW11_IV]|uniref:penicillin acylase family protein n=1 Tax=Bacteriovorax sp. BSW11_IV TaxID=1353529 RepID=UPI00038A3C41|nr:penicillin acylase family protein [Bacteriovorax sp. BSW11_IV]EQC49495.1 penicillin amidase [Bacteriovorax sp. BSW11_IV]
MKLKIGINKLKYKNEDITITRQENGAISVEAKTDIGLAFAQGIIHATDRLMQMILVRTIAGGRLCELLQDNDETFAIDKFMREMALYHEAKKEIVNLSEDDFNFCKAYAFGVNTILKSCSRPFEFKLVGLHPEEWKIEDSLVTIKIMSYVGLAQTQGDIEKLIIQMMKSDTPIQKLKELFSPHLDGVDEKLISTLKKTHLKDPLVPKEIKQLSALPKIVASNNWVISGKKTKSGGAIQCNDPHLECNRLPAIWYELKATTPNNTFFGITMPGLPGFIMGRSKYISFGFTYGFMDMIDYFIEEAKGGKIRSEDQFTAIMTRKEIIKRKKHHPEEVYIRETSNGVIEFDISKQLLPDGLYLSRAWSNHKDGSAKSIEAIRELLNCKSAKEFQLCARKVTISCNWLVSDIDGNIAYQQSGRLPKRSHSGLYPRFGYIKEQQWQGIHEDTQLAHFENPDCGFITTANNDMNQEGKPLSINMPMGSYRKDRISELLQNENNFTAERMREIQCDLVSIQARQYLELIRDEITNYSELKELSEWDLRYNKESIQANKFEIFYHNLLEEIFTEEFLDQKAYSHLKTETNLLVDYYGNFDRIIFSNNEIWFAKTSREQFLKRALTKTNNFLKENKIPSWGEKQTAFMTNIFFDGKLPKFLGFDYGPIQIEGNRATIVQGALYRAHGRLSSFCPSWRYITDMGNDKTYSILAGGISDRRFSKWYTTDIEKWLNFEYKEISL